MNSVTSSGSVLKSLIPLAYPITVQTLYVLCGPHAIPTYFNSGWNKLINYTDKKYWVWYFFDIFVLHHHLLLNLA